MDGLEAFLGYAENYKSIGDEVLERPDSDIAGLKPETSETTELGLRYNSDNLDLSAVYFANSFDNRLFFLSPESDSGPDYDIGTSGTYFNSGGIDSDGLELSATYHLTSELSAYVAYTTTNAEYLGTGDALVDEALGIVPGNTVIGIPDSQYVVSLDWAGEKAFAGISSKMTGDRYADLDNSWKIDGFNLVDVNLGANITGTEGVLKNLKVNLIINNLFDEDYLGTIVSGGAWIGAPRTYVMSLTMDF